MTKGVGQLAAGRPEDRPENKPDDRPDDSGQGVLPYVLLVAMGVGWGLAVSTSKIAGTAGGHPLGLALWQVCTSGGLLGLLTLVRFGMSRPRPNVIGFSLFCGAVGVAFPAFALFSAAVHLPAGVVAIAFASMPLFTYIISALFRVEDVEWRRLGGVAVGLVAMALIIVPNQALPDPEQTPWVFLCLAASVSMSVENVYAGGMRPADISSVQLSCGRQFGAIFWLTPIVLIGGFGIPVAAEWGAVQWAATATGVLSGTCFTILLIVIRTSGPVFATQASYLITLCGVGWGMLLFGETHSGYVWAALLLVLLGAMLVKPRPPRAAGLFMRKAV